MNLEAAIALVDQEVYRQTQKHLNELQQAIVASVWQRQKYLEIADAYGCTEGHAKDTGSLLWQLLSQAWEQKVTKSNFRRIINQQLKSFEQSSLEVRKDIASFNTKQVAEDINFVGRKRAISSLQELISQNRQVIVLQGEGGVGKTTLAQKFLAEQDFELTLEVLMAKETVDVVSANSVVEEWLQRDLNEASGKEFGVTLARLKRYLEQHRVGILIDNLEPALDQDGRFIAAHRSYVELLRILADSSVKSVTIITSRDRLCEGEINLEHYRLPGLELQAWQRYFAAHQLQFQPQEVKQMHQTYGGNAKVMGILCGIAQEDYAGNLGQYWQDNHHDPLVETDLKNLVVSQFERLRQLDLQAYLLLCRLGCYRFQDLPRVAMSGLTSLLWDVEHQQQRRVIKSLRNRSLLEFSHGRYWLHPVVQAEARLRNQQSATEWYQANQQIANYLSASVTKISNIQAGMMALEAYYHHVAINDYSAAAKVILQSRENQWGQFLTLGTNLYRLGIIEPLSAAINQILTQVKNDRYRSELNNILGDLYWTSGKIAQAIACQQQTIATSQSCLTTVFSKNSSTWENQHDKYYWQMLEVDSWLSLGLYNLDLWELTTAAELFQRVIQVAYNTKHHPWSEKAALGLALVNSYLTISDTPDYISLRLYRLIIELEDQTYSTGRFTYFMQILGQILFNHQRLDQAEVMWHKAIALAQTGHYTQIEAKCLIGLGNIEFQAGNYAIADHYQYQAVEMLEKLNAKCDLAAAYVQRGITLRISQAVASQDYFQRAILLYQQIKAPKQIERVESLGCRY